MFSTYQIAGFLNQLYLQNKMMKFPGFFACRCKFMRIKFWLKILREDMLKNGYGRSGYMTLNLIVAQ